MSMVLFHWAFNSPMEIIKQLVDLEASNNVPCKNFLLKILVLFDEIWKARYSALHNETHLSSEIIDKYLSSVLNYVLIIPAALLFISK